MTKVVYWSIDRFVMMITKMLLNKFDCLIVIEGNRGLGKSTFAYKILKKVHSYFRAITRATGGVNNSEFKEWYHFNPIMQLKDPVHCRHVIYTQKDVINFYDKWHVSAISDELINVAFNREFFSEDQKNLVKMINMNRDHGNLLIGCVPQFQVLDNQIKNLCKIRITIARRGLAVIQTPNRTIYNRDRWDSANNEKIEREWLKKGSGLPQYSRLNTFRGMIKFPALNPKEQFVYDKIKGNERNVIKKDLGVTDPKEKQSAIDIALDRLLNNRIKSGEVLEGIGATEGIDPAVFKYRIKQRLIKMNKPSIIYEYYYSSKARKKEQIEGIS